jgi:hypothetical protein
VSVSISINRFGRREKATTKNTGTSVLASEIFSPKNGAFDLKRYCVLYAKNWFSITKYFISKNWQILTKIVIMALTPELNF